MRMLNGYDSHIYFVRYIKYGSVAQLCVMKMKILNILTFI